MDKSSEFSLNGRCLVIRGLAVVLASRSSVRMPAKESRREINWFFRLIILIHETSTKMPEPPHAIHLVGLAKSAGKHLMPRNSRAAMTNLLRKNENEASVVRFSLRIVKWLASVLRWHPRRKNSKSRRRQHHNLRQILFAVVIRRGIYTRKRGKWREIPSPHHRASSPQTWRY